VNNEEMIKTKLMCLSNEIIIKKKDVIYSGFHINENRI